MGGLFCICSLYKSGLLMRFATAQQRLQYLQPGFNRIASKVANRKPRQSNRSLLGR